MSEIITRDRPIDEPVSADKCPITTRHAHGVRVRRDAVEANSTTTMTTIKFRSA